MTDLMEGASEENEDDYIESHLKGRDKDFEGNRNHSMYESGEERATIVGTQFHEPTFDNNYDLQESKEVR